MAIKCTHMCATIYQVWLRFYQHYYYYHVIHIYMHTHAHPQNRIGYKELATKQWLM